MRVLISAIAVLLAFSSSSFAGGSTLLCAHFWTDKETANLAHLLMLQERHVQAGQRAADELNRAMANLPRGTWLALTMVNTSAVRGVRLPPTMDAAARIAHDVATAAIRENPLPARAAIIQRIVQDPQLANFPASVRDDLAAVAIVNATIALRTRYAARYASRLSVRDCASGLLNTFVGGSYWTGGSAPPSCAPTACLFAPFVARIEAIRVGFLRFQQPIPLLITFQEAQATEAALQTFTPFLDQIAEVRDAAARVEAVIGAFHDDIRAVTGDLRTFEFVPIQIGNPLAPHLQYATLRKNEAQEFWNRAKNGIELMRSTMTMSDPDARDAVGGQGLNEMVSAFHFVFDTIAGYQNDSFRNNFLARELLQVGTASAARDLLRDKRDDAARQAKDALDQANLLATLLP